MLPNFQQRATGNHIPITGPAHEAGAASESSIPVPAFDTCIRHHIHIATRMLLYLCSRMLPEKSGSLG